MFYALISILFIKISSFAQNLPFIVTETKESYIFDISEEYLGEIRDFYQKVDPYHTRKFNCWGMKTSHGGYCFKTIEYLKGLIFPNITTSLSDLEDMSSQLSSLFGFYELLEENKLPQYVTPTVGHFNDIIEKTNAKYENLSLPLKFYIHESLTQQDLFNYLYKFVYEDALPVVDPRLNMARYLQDTLHMKAGIVNPALMVKAYQKLANHFLFFFRYLLRNKYLHKDYRALYDLVIPEIRKIVEFDLSNVFLDQVYKSHIKSNFYLDSADSRLIKPNVRMSLSFKEMLSNMISDLVARQREVFPEKSITMNTQNLVNEFFESVPEIDPNVTFLPKNSQGEFMRYEDFLNLSKEQLKFLIENVQIEQ